MANDTDDTRTAAYGIAERAGFEITQIGKGGRVVVRLTKSGQKDIDALVKTASLGSAMVTAKSGNPDTATISGFSSDVSHVLFAVGGRRGSIDAYLVPRSEAEEAFRKAHRGWLATHPSAKESTTWVIYFSGRGSPDANNYDKLWAKYRLVSNPDPTLSAQAPVRSAEGATILTISEAKRLLAASFGVPVENVKITIEA